MNFKSVAFGTLLFFSQVCADPFSFDGYCLQLRVISIEREIEKGTFQWELTWSPEDNVCADDLFVKVGPEFSVKYKEDDYSIPLDRSFIGTDRVVDWTSFQQDVKQIVLEVAIEGLKNFDYSRFGPSLSREFGGFKQMLFTFGSSIVLGACTLASIISWAVLRRQEFSFFSSNEFGFHRGGALTEEYLGDFYVKTMSELKFRLPLSILAVLPGLTCAGRAYKVWRDSQSLAEKVRQIFKIVLSAQRSCQIAAYDQKEIQALEKEQGFELVSGGPSPTTAQSEDEKPRNGGGWGLPWPFGSRAGS